MAGQRCMYSPIQKANRVLALIVVGLSVCIFAVAQTSPGIIRGRVALPNGSALERAVAIRLESSRGVRSNEFTDNRGEFEFPNVPVGIYQVVVEADSDRFETTSVTVEVFPDAPSIVTIILKEKESEIEARRRRTISSKELDTNVPGAARKEFEKASALSKEQKHEEAIVHLRKAISLYQNYLAAINDLGTQLLATGRLEEAATEFRRAVALDAKAFNPHLNLGIVLVQQHNFSEAAEHLKRAVSLQGNSPAAHLFLGQALIGLENLSEAEAELKAAYDLGGTRHAVALYYLGQLYLNQNRQPEALAMFERYLSEQPDGTKSVEVKRLIALLK